MELARVRPGRRRGGRRLRRDRATPCIRGRRAVACTRRRRTASADGDAAYGWDGEPARPFLGRRRATSGRRRRGVHDRVRQPGPRLARGRRCTPTTAAAGSAPQLLEAAARGVPARWAHRRSASTAGTRDGRAAFAAGTGFEQKTQGDQPAAAPRRASTAPTLSSTATTRRDALAGDYELVRRLGAHARRRARRAWPTMTAAINDAPPTTSRSRTRSSRPSGSAPTRHAQIERGHRLYRVRRPAPRHRRAGRSHRGRRRRRAPRARRAARHRRASRSHRGHRLGLLLKADMMPAGCAEAEPQLRDDRHLERRVERPHDRRQRAARLPGHGPGRWSSSGGSERLGSDERTAAARAQLARRPRRRSGRSAPRSVGRSSITPTTWPDGEHAGGRCRRRPGRP